MNNNFEQLKKETSELIKSQISFNEKVVLNFINTLLEKFSSRITVRKNMSIASFETLLTNSSTPEEFKNYLDKLDVNKVYEIEDLKGLNESIEYNEICKNDNLEGYEDYKKFLDSKIKLNDNLFLLEYTKL